MLDEPRDDRVRVPHFSHLQLVASPHEQWHLGYNVQQSSGFAKISAKTSWAVDRLLEIRNDTVAPSVDLVPKDAEAPCPARANWTLTDDAPLGPGSIPDRGLLDHISSLRYEDLESGVVKIACRASLQPRRNRLEDESVQAHEIPTGT
jgi:hypothetical protein